MLTKLFSSLVFLSLQIVVFSAAQATTFNSEELTCLARESKYPSSHRPCEYQFAFSSDSQFIFAAESAVTDKTEIFNFKIFSVPSMKEYISTTLSAQRPDQSILLRSGVIFAAFSADSKKAVACTQTDAVVIDLTTKQKVLTWNSARGVIVSCRLSQDETSFEIQETFAPSHALWNSVNLNTLAIKKGKVEEAAKSVNYVLPSFEPNLMVEEPLPIFFDEAGTMLKSGRIKLTIPEYPGLTYEGFALWLSDITTDQKRIPLKNTTWMNDRSKLALLKSDDQSLGFIQTLTVAHNNGIDLSQNSVISSVYDLTTGETVLDLVRDLPQGQGYFMPMVFSGNYSSTYAMQTKFHAKFSPDNKTLYLIGSNVKVGGSSYRLQAISLEK